MDHHNHTLSPNKLPQHRSLIHKRSSQAMEPTAAQATIIPVYYSSSSKDGGKHKILHSSSKSKGMTTASSWKRRIFPGLALGMVLLCMLWTFLVSTSLIQSGRYDLYGSLSRNGTHRIGDDDMIPSRMMILASGDDLGGLHAETPPEVTMTLEAVQSRRRQRRERCRPPPHVQSEELRSSLSTQVSTTKTTTIHIDPVHSRDHPTLWQDYCQQANINKKSRVVITNALSMPVATALTLLLAQQCDVRSILVVDAMAPNTKAQRARHLQTYRTLYRAIPTLKLVVPTHAAGLGKLGKNELESPLQWLVGFAPSHILLFETSDAYRASRVLWEEFMSPSGQWLHQLRHSVLSLQQILSYAQSRLESSDGVVDPLLVLHGTIASAPTYPDEQSHSPDLYSTVMPQMHAIWTNYYAALQNHGTHRTIPVHSVSCPAVGLDAPSSLGSMEDAMVAFLRALQPAEGGGGPVRILIAPGNDAGSRVHETLDGSHPEISLLSPDTFGIPTTRFPCASSCYEDADPSKNCDASIWDGLYPISQAITEPCVYVMYYVNFDTELDRLFETQSMTTEDPPLKRKVCRVAFVSRQSPLVQEALQQVENGDTEGYNGQWKIQDWTLVWLSTADASQPIDDSILRIEPSRFFAPTVQKVMYTESNVFAQSADPVLVHIFSNMDRAARDVHYTKDYRAGLEHMHRLVEQEAAPARSVSFFAAERSAQDEIKTIVDYIQRLESSGVDLPARRRHFNFYKQMNHWMQSDTHRPLMDGAGPQPYRTAFPWQWISTQLMMHDLQSDAARRLRCSWYDAHLYWGPDQVIPGTEDLSFAYMMGRQRLEGSIGVGLEEDPSWIPQLDPGTQQRVLVYEKNEAFIRIMKGEGK